MAIKDLNKVKKHVFFCNGSSCKKGGAESLTDAVRSGICQFGIHDEIHTTKTLCNGRCEDGPIVIAMPAGIWFKKMTPEKAESFVREFLIEDRVREEDLLYEYK
jgi:(2Fe-2S) ferredoxin